MLYSCWIFRHFLAETVMEESTLVKVKLNLELSDRKKEGNSEIVTYCTVPDSAGSPDIVIKPNNVLDTVFSQICVTLQEIFHTEYIGGVASHQLLVRLYGTQKENYVWDAPQGVKFTKQLFSSQDQSKLIGEYEIGSFLRQCVSPQDILLTKPYYLQEPELLSQASSRGILWIYYYYGNLERC